MFRRFKMYVNTVREKIFKKFRKRPVIVNTPARNEGERRESGIRFLHPLAIYLPNKPLFLSPNVWKFNKDYFYIIHYAVTRDWSFTAFYNFFISKNLNTEFLQRDGTLWQQSHGDRGGWHAGRASVIPYKFRSRGGKKISHLCRGVEIDCLGKLKKRGGGFTSSNNRYSVVPDNVRYVTREMGYQCEGYFEKFTEKQEETLAHLIAYNVAMGLPAQNHLGHDEIARPIGRKTDPGGSLSMPLDKFIEAKALPLVAQYEKENV